MNNTSCPVCHQPVSETFFFCPNCGTKLKEAPLTITKELGVYILSVVLPPLGLYPGVKYLMQSDPKKKRVGTIAIVLTILSSVITIWFSLSLIGSITQGISSQQQQYQLLGQ